MKVLFNGNEKKTNTMIVTCTAKSYSNNGCSSILQISSKDIWCVKDDVKYHYLFRCPCCNQITEIAEEIPSEIRSEIKLPVGEIVYG